jgi:hypothetical protein
MVLVTLVGKNLARVGLEFIYRGPLPECRDCKLKTVCFNLDKGRKYKVTALRTMHHNCRIHEEGVRVVEVEKIPIRIGIKSNLAIEGSMLSYESIECENLDCDYYKICMEPTVKIGEKLKIVKICEDIPCEKGDNLKIIEIE